MRTVGTKLTVDAGQAKKELKDTEQAVRSFEDELIDTARQGKLTATAIADIGKTAVGAFPPAEKAAAKLNGEIAETAREIQRLDREFRRTGDVTLFGDLEKQLAKLKAKLKAKDFLDRRDGERMGEQLVEGIGVQIMGRLGPIMARAPLNLGALGPVGIAVGGAVAVSAAAVVGSAVAGAVVGGAGLGGMVGGIMLAGKDPLVRAEAKALQAEFGTLFSESAEAFIPVTRRAIRQIRAEMGTLRPFLQSIFSKAAEFVEPLTKGLVGFTQSALRGVTNLVERARPVIDVISSRLPEVGEALSDALDDISGDSRSAAAGVDLILQGLIGVIRFSGKVVGFFVDMFRTLVNVADAAHTVTEELMGWNPLFEGRIESGRQKIDGLKAILNQTGDAAGNAVGPMNDLGGAVGETAEEAVALNTAFDELFGRTMNLDQATIAYKEGLVDLREELLDGKRTLDINTKAGRENTSAVLDQIEKIKAQRDARLENGQTLDEVNRKYGVELSALRKTMVQMGYNKTEIDALIGKYRRIPPKVDTKVALNKQQAERDLERFSAAVARATRAREMRIRVRYTLPSQSGALGAVGQLFNRWGGLYEHAAVGTLREAHVSSPVATARYAYAEPQTGGEAFIPKFGDYGRSMSILDKAASWYGARVTTGGMGGGTARVLIDLTGADDDMLRRIRKSVRIEGGGNVQVAFGRG